MRLNLSTTKTIQGGRAPLQSKSYKTTTNNTIFKIVTQGLYIRPIEAIVREICTNALDGHIKAGKPEVPFEITLPNRLHPYFTVRDFGCSMDNDTVFNVYAVLGESTKNSCSTSIGGWGVGGKSPAAYTDTFFIKAYLNGIRRIYQSSYLNDRSPLELILEGSSDLPQGIEVQIPVQEKDFEKFITAIKTQISAFDVKPIIINSGGDFEYSYDLTTVTPLNLAIPMELPNEQGELERVKHPTNIYPNLIRYTELAIRMGCVLYPINITADIYGELEKGLTAIKKISGDNNFIIDLPVDTVDIKPSREDLDYTERTNYVLQSVIRTINKHYHKEATFAYFRVRHLPLHDKLTILMEKCSTGIFNYIVTKSQDKNKNNLKSYIANFSSNLHDDLRKLTKILPSKKNKLVQFKYSLDTLTICDGEKSQKYKNLIGRHRLGMNQSLEITIFRKSTGYIKKLNYWQDTKTTVLPSGLVIVPNKREYNHTVIRDLKFYESTNQYLCMDEEEITLFVPTFEKYYKKVNIIDLPEIPSIKKEMYRSNSINSYSPTIHCTVINPINMNTSAEERYVSHSFKSIEALKNEYEVENPTSNHIFLVKEKSDTISTNLLKELARYHNTFLVIFSVPLAFKDKILNKTNLGIQDLNTMKDVLFNSIKDKDIKKIKTDYINHQFQGRLEDSITRTFRNSILTLIYETPELKNHFLKFLPNKVSKHLYLNIAAKCDFNSQELEYIDREVKTLTDRAIKRISLITERKPTLKLLRHLTYYNSSDVLQALELVSLNFKGFTYDNK